MSVLDGQVQQEVGYAPSHKDLPSNATDKFLPKGHGDNSDSDNPYEKNRIIDAYVRSERRLNDVAHEYQQKQKLQFSPKINLEQIKHYVEVTYFKSGTPEECAKKRSLFFQESDSFDAQEKYVAKISALFSDDSAVPMNARIVVKKKINNFIAKEMSDTSLLELENEHDFEIFCINLVHQNAKMFRKLLNDPNYGIASNLPRLENSNNMRYEMSPDKQERSGFFTPMLSSLMNSQNNKSSNSKLEPEDLEYLPENLTRGIISNVEKLSDLGKKAYYNDRFRQANKHASLALTEQELKHRFYPSKYYLGYLAKDLASQGNDKLAFDIYGDIFTKKPTEFKDEIEDNSKERFHSLVRLHQKIGPSISEQITAEANKFKKDEDSKIPRETIINKIYLPFKKTIHSKNREDGTIAYHYSTDSLLTKIDASPLTEGFGVIEAIAKQIAHLDKHLKDKKYPDPYPVKEELLERVHKIKSNYEKQELESIIEEYSSEPLENRSCKARDEFLISIEELCEVNPETGNYVFIEKHPILPKVNTGPALSDLNKRPSK